MVASSPRYLRVEFEASKAFPPSVDDAEFYFTPGDALVQFRCARRNGSTDFGANRRRMDGIRIALNFESVRIGVCEFAEAVLLTDGEEARLRG